MSSRLQRAEPKAGTRGGTQQAERIGPTPEQRAKADFVRSSQDTIRGQSTSVAYRKRPLFETLAKGQGSGIGRDDLLALRFYRDKYEETAQSLTRCALDVQARGGGPPSCLPPKLAASDDVQRLEAAVGAVVDTVRAVALEDQPYSDVAVARWGGRKQNWIETEKRRGRTKKGGRMVFVDKIVPKSGRHRERIRDEFLLGVRRLRRAHQLMTSTAAAASRHSGRLREPSLAVLTQPAEVTDAAPMPGVDPEFLDERGIMRPWGEVAAIIRERVNDAS